jgi:hypothetical protein
VDIAGLKCKIKNYIGKTFIKGCSHSLLLSEKSHGIPLEKGKAALFFPGNRGSSGE